MQQALDELQGRLGATVPRFPRRGPVAEPEPAAGSISVRRAPPPRDALPPASPVPAGTAAHLRRRLLRAEAEHAAAAAESARGQALAEELAGRVAALRTERRRRDRRHREQQAALQAVRDELAGALAQARAEHRTLAARLDDAAAEQRGLRDEATAAARAAAAARGRAQELADALAEARAEVVAVREAGARAVKTAREHGARALADARAEADAGQAEAAWAAVAREETEARLLGRIAALRTERRARDRRHRAALAAARAPAAELADQLERARIEAGEALLAAQLAAEEHERCTIDLRRRLEALIADVEARDSLARSLVASALAEAEHERAQALRALGDADALRHRVTTLAGQLGAYRAAAARARRAGERDRDALAAEAERAGALTQQIEVLRAELTVLRDATRRPRRRVLRHSWMLGAGAGMLLVADGVTTLVWQEPISALYAQREQNRLRSELPGVMRRFAPLAASARVRLPSLASQARKLARITPAKGPLGRIAIPSIGVRFVMVQGTGASALTLGPGHYTGTVLPGQPGTVGIAGHRTTYLAPFRRLDELGRGARIVLHMPYGRFTYRVTGRRAVDPTDTSVLRSRGGRQRLVLTTCDPVYSDAQRLVVFAELRSVKRA